MDNKHYNGFTLLELIIVISIIAIVSAIAVPTLYTTFHKLKVDKAATQIAWDLKHAQSAAIKERANCNVSFSEEGAYTAIVQTIPTKTIIDVNMTGSAGHTGRYPGISFFRNEDGDTGTYEDPITFGGDSINFKPTRKVNIGSLFLMPSSDFGSNRKDRWRKITISMAGRIRIYKYNNGWE